MNANFAAELERRSVGGAPCLLLPDGNTQTYADVFGEAKRIAAALAASGCAPGDRVAVQVDKHPQVLPLYLGTLMAGAVYLPLNPAYRRHELDYFLADATPRVVVCDADRRAEIEALATGATLFTFDAGGGSLYGQAARHDTRFETVPRSWDDLASILYTSGTTGRSKGAMITHGNLASNARALVEAWGFSSDDVLLHALPIYHIHGLFVATHCALLSGARMLWLPRFDAAEVVAKLPQATVMMGVPTFYTRLLAQPGLSVEACRNTRLFVSGSAPLLAETFRAFEQRTGQRILERYGMTETGMNCSNPLHGERVAGSVGPPLPGIEIRIRDEHGAPCPEGSVGSIELRGPNVCRGYWNKPGATAESFTPEGWFITGDVGRIDERGYLSIVGRAKDMVISGGLNIYPIEIEQILDALDGVEESAVVGVPDADFGEALVAFVVPRGQGLTESGIISALKAKIASFKVPRRILIVPQLPRNAMGKVVKARLREQIATSR